MSVSHSNALRLEVAQRTVIARDVVEIDFAHGEKAALPEVSPGAHLLVHLSPELSRQYSLCNGPADRDVLRIAVKLEANGRGGSAAMHQLAVGDTVLAEFPRNAFTLKAAAHTVLFAAGIGITPIISMLKSLAAAHRPYTLFYSARDEDHAPYLDLLRLPPYASNVHVRFSARDGRINVASALQALPSESRLYTCGPAGFMQEVLGAAQGLGWPADRLHQEHFLADAPDQTGPSFKVVLAKTGRELFVGADESIVTACRREGCDIPTSCEQGVCGTCLVTVLEGKPDHRDLYLTDEEKNGNKMMLACCSRARSAELVLDL
jgi:vanillate O-demethylase ferredoxin subunit